MASVTHHTLKADTLGSGTSPMPTPDVDTSTATGPVTINVVCFLQNAATFSDGVEPNPDPITDNKGNIYLPLGPVETYVGGGAGAWAFKCENAIVGANHIWYLNKAAGYETNEATMLVAVVSGGGAVQPVVYTDTDDYDGSINPSAAGSVLLSFWGSADYSGQAETYSIDASTPGWTLLDYDGRADLARNNAASAWKTAANTSAHPIKYASTPGSVSTGSGMYMIEVLEGGPPPQVAYPDADVTDGSWTPSTGTDNYAVIDDDTDAEWIETTGNTTGKFGLEALSTPDSGTQTFSFRASGSPEKKLIATLIEGSSTSRGTVTVDPLPGTATAYSFNPSGTSNYADLDIQFEVADATSAPTASVTYGAVGTGASGTTSCAPNYPTGISAATSELILVVTGRSNTANTVPAVTGGGWTRIGGLEGGTGTWGVDTGTRRVDYFKKDTVLGTETGTITVTLAGTTANTMRATIHRVEKNSGYTLGAALVTGADTTNGTGYSATGGTVGFSPNDLLMIAVAQNIDTGTQSAQSITASGITFGTRTNRASTAVTNGNDHRHIVDSVPVSSGSGTVAPTYSYTISASGSGPTGFLRLRSVPPTVKAKVYTSKLTIPAAAGGAYTLTCQHGTYSVSGQSATLLRSKLLTAQNGTYSITGQSAGLNKGRMLTCQYGAYSISGQPATLLKSKVLVASAGSYAVSGQSAALLRSKLLTAQVGSYAVSGQSATLLRSKVITAEHGTYSVTGQSADITHTGAAAGYTLTCQPGSYSISGQAATLLKSKVITAQSGSYSVTGQSANLVKGRVLVCQYGTYAISGQSANLLRSKVLTAEPGAYSITGQDAVITHESAPGAYVLTCLHGTYEVVGQSADLTYTRAGGFIPEVEVDFTDYRKKKRPEEQLAELIEQREVLKHEKTEVQRKIRKREATSESLPEKRWQISEQITEIDGKIAELTSAGVYLPGYIQFIGDITARAQQAKQVMAQQAVRSELQAKEEIDMAFVITMLAEL